MALLNTHFNPCTKAGRIWSAAGFVFSPLTPGFGGTGGVFQGQLSLYQILLPTRLLSIAIRAADVGGFDQIGQGDVGGINDPTSLELKATVSTPEMPGKKKKKQNQGNMEDFGKLYLGCLSRN